MLLDDRRQRFEDGLSPLPREEPKLDMTKRPRRRSSRLIECAQPPRRAGARSNAGAPCGTTRIFLGARAAVGEQPQRRRGHHDHEAQSEAPRARAPGVTSAARAPCAASRRAVGELLRQGEDVLAVATAEDAVLCWGAPRRRRPAEDARSARSAAGRLRDRRDEARLLRPGRLVDDDDLRDRLSRQGRSAPCEHRPRTFRSHAWGGNVETMAARKPAARRRTLHV